MFSLDAGFHAEDRGKAADGEESGRWTDAFTKAAEQESACRRTRVVNVCDREGDMCALLSEGCACADSPGGTGLLVHASRSNRRRALTADGRAKDLFGHMADSQTLLLTRKERLGTTLTTRISVDIGSCPCKRG